MELIAAKSAIQAAKKLHMSASGDISVAVVLVAFVL